MSIPSGTFTPLRAIAFFPAASAAVREDGAVRVDGGAYSVVRASKLPRAMEPLTLVVMLEIPQLFCDETHPFEISFRDPDGNVLDAQIEGVARFERVETPAGAEMLPGVWKVAVSIDGFAFTEYGTWRIVLTTNGNELASYPVAVVPSVPPAAENPGSGQAARTITGTEG